MRTGVEILRREVTDIRALRDVSMTDLSQMHTCYLSLCKGVAVISLLKPANMRAAMLCAEAT